MIPSPDSASAQKEGPPTLNRCEGRCCARFYLPDLPEIQRRGDAWKAGGDKKNWAETQQIADMLIVVEKPQENWWGYTCKHWDATSGDCMIHETRPDMCRGFGVTYPCNFQGCKWDAAMKPPINPGETKELKVPPVA